MLKCSVAEPTIPRALLDWWRQNLARRGGWGALRAFVAEAAEFIRDSMPDRARARYGDIDYDWDYRVDTTAANVGWRNRLLGTLVGPGYQPCDPPLFRATLDQLGDLRGFTFVDVGSGKGRALLMASDYPFARIIGVEILPELNAIAQRNIAAYSSERQQCRRIEAVRADARDFELPPDPLVIFLFNPLPEAALEQFVARLEQSLGEHPRRAFVVYHNPVLEHLLSRSSTFARVTGTMQFAIYRAADQQ